MIVKGKALDQLLLRPAPTLRAILFYGPNEGRVREYAARVAQTVVADLSDPFRVTNLNATDLKDDPARLADEAAAIAMTGGRRVVRMRGMGDAHTASFSNFLADPKGDTLVVVEAGELTKTSRLRKLFESSTVCAVAACYEENSTDLDSLVVHHLRQHGLTINSDAKAYLAQCLGEDRLATRQELDKLVLYKGPHNRASRRSGVKDVVGIVDTLDGADINDVSGVSDTNDVQDTGDISGVVDTRDILDIAGSNDARDGVDTQDTWDTGDTADGGDTNDTNDSSDINDRCVSLADVTACIGDSTIQGLDGICDAMATGNLASLDNQLARSFDTSMAPVAIIRSASNHLLRVQLAAAMLVQGATVDAALRTLRPPLHFSRTDAFRKQLRMWNSDRLARGLDLLLACEAACKTTGAPDKSLCGQALMQVASLARPNP